MVYHIKNYVALHKKGKKKIKFYNHREKIDL